jgi:hypothetical protein
MTINNPLNGFNTVIESSYPSNIDSTHQYMSIHMRSIANSYYAIGMQEATSPDGTEMGYWAMQASLDINLMLSIEFGLKVLFVEARRVNTPDVPMLKIKNEIKIASHNLDNLLNRLLLSADPVSCKKIITSTLDILSIDEDMFKEKLLRISDCFAKERYYFESLFIKDSCKIPCRTNFNMVLARVVNELVNEKVPISSDYC